jgi:hypothetical protein
MKGPYGGNAFTEQSPIDKSDRRKYIRRRFPMTLAQINRPKRAEVAEVVAHPSEPGWNLPADHERHFNKFPKGKSTAK